MITPVFPRASDEVTVSQEHAAWHSLVPAPVQKTGTAGPTGSARYAIAAARARASLGGGRGAQVVYLNRSLPGAQAQACTLTLVARDLGVPPRASLLLLTVIIARQERSPSLTFEHLVYQVEVSESFRR